MKSPAKKMPPARAVPKESAVVRLQLRARHQAEARIREYALELERSNAELKEFAYAVSHDLQEPLRAITNNCKILEDKVGTSLDPEAAECLNFVLQGARRMQVLIQGLLEYSRVSREAGPMEPVELSMSCEEALQNLKELISDCGAKITVGELPAVKCHRSQMIRLLQNLLGNALKFRASRVPEIRVTARREGSEWIVAVTDNGIGIERRHFERIFVIFQRLHTREEIPGEGIGLATCKKIVEHHGGRLWVESKLGEGTTFYFSLPDSASRIGRRSDEGE